MPTTSPGPRVLAFVPAGGAASPGGPGISSIYLLVQYKPQSPEAGA